MGRGTVTNVDPDDVDAELAEAEDVEQGKVGNLFAIHGDEWAEVEWSIQRYRTRQEIGNDPAGLKTEWVADHYGEVNGQEMAHQLGGGTFRFMGYRKADDGRKRLIYNKPIAIAGPRRDHSYVPPPPAPVPVITNGAPHSDPLLRDLLDRMDRRLERLEEHGRVTPPQQTSLKDMAETMVLLNGLNGHQREPNGEVVKQMLGFVQQGVDLANSQGGGSGGGTDWAKLAETVMPIARDFLDQVRETRRMREAARRGRPVSRAEVVDPAGGSPTPPTEPQPIDAAEIRALAVIDALSRAIVEGEQPEDFAVTLEALLPAPELFQLKAATSTEMVMSALIAKAGDHYPVLKTPQAAQYVDRVLTEIRTDPPAAE